MPGTPSDGNVISNAIKIWLCTIMSRHNWKVFVFFLQPLSTGNFLKHKFIIRIIMLSTILQLTYCVFQKVKIIINRDYILLL
jgi:hypothetical protein